MSKFEVGKRYRRNDCGFDPVLCTKRTEKTVWMFNPYSGAEWSARIRHDEDGNEWAVECHWPKSDRVIWSPVAFQAKYPEEE